MHTVAAKAVAFGEAATPAFTAYAIRWWPTPGRSPPRWPRRAWPSPPGHGHPPGDRRHGPARSGRHAARGRLAGAGIVLDVCGLGQGLGARAAAGHRGGHHPGHGRSGDGPGGRPDGARSCGARSRPAGSGSRSPHWRPRSRPIPARD
ncbi:hypothetical protein [Streptomyces thioluteus]|uniref:hypothetical protein n=1 Tax=Streptomyces thioluteus TaxID=66431 RepID=UPI0031E50F04